MKSEYSIILVLGFGIISAILWYFLNQIPIDTAKEYSLFFFLILTIGLITYLLHGKGILISPEQNYSMQFSRSVRNGIIYHRMKFRSENLISQKIRGKNKSQKAKVLPYNYSRKRYRDLN